MEKLNAHDMVAIIERAGRTYEPEDYVSDPALDQIDLIEQEKLRLKEKL